MLLRSSVLSAASRAARPQARSLSRLNDTASTAVEKSCYLKIDFKIREDAPVFEAIQRMAAHRIGALAVTSATDPKTVIGVVSERDYLSKVALLGKSSRTTKVAEIATMGANLVTVTEDEPVDDCMRKLLARDIRHLLVKDKNGVVVSMFSIKVRILVYIWHFLELYTFVIK